MKKLIVAFSALALAATAFANSAFPDISLADLKKAIAAKDVTILDVNGPESYAEGHIPGAIDYLAVKDLATKLPKDKAALVVAYCGSPQCGAYAQAAAAATKLGYTNVKHYVDGISGWKEAGEPTEKAE
ncbi:MAG: rhodanese-like domain-containing protein [Chthoniobacterales bacterium]